MDDRRRITHNLSFIKESICDDLERFVDGLIEKDIFDIDIKEMLKSVNTAMGKSDLLVCKILAKGPLATGVFVDLLRKNKDKYQHVLRKIEADTEGDGASGGSVAESLDQILIVKGLLVKEGVHEEPIISNSVGNMPTLALAETDDSQYECLQKNYTDLQIAYAGLRQQLIIKQDQLKKINQEKIRMKKELKDVNDENQLLHAKTMNLEMEAVMLKSQVEDLERNLKQNENNLADMQRKIAEFRNEDRIDRGRLEEKIDTKMDVMLKLLSNIATKVDCNLDLPKPNSTHERTTPSTSQGIGITRTPGKKQINPNDTCKGSLHKTNSSGRKK